MKIVFVSAEMTPYASTGGLGEVSGSLPRALAEAGDSVFPIMPMYRSLIEAHSEYHTTGLKLRIPMGFRAYTAEIWTNRDVSPEVYFIRRDECFDRQGIYGNGERDYDDNLERYVFFQKAVVALIDELGLTPDIVHGNDWTTGLLPLFLRHGIHGMGRTQKEKSVFTIHNLAYQGVFSASQFPVMNLPFSCFSIDTMEFFGKINCVKAGLVTSDRVTTVSEGFAREILTPEYGCGLDGVLRTLPEPGVTGIPNGIDNLDWDPAQDPSLAHPFDADRLKERAGNKAALMKECTLDPRGDPFLVGMIGRLVDQKGLDVMADAIPALMEREDVRFILLGSGESRYEDRARIWMKKWPGRFHAHIGYNPALAHRIEAAIDAHLIPSRFEPCGLGQFHALRYGTLPVVNPTGGLDDAVQELSENGRTGNGIRINELSPQGLVDALQRASAWVRDRRWPTIQARLMKEDHSWDTSAKRYQSLYRSLLDSAE